MNINDAKRQPSARFTRINGTMNEGGFVLIDKSKIVTLLKNSTLVDNPEYQEEERQSNVLINAPKTHKHDPVVELFALIINGMAFYFGVEKQGKYNRDAAYDILIK